MNMELAKYKELEKKFGKVGSWAIWARPGEKAKSNTADMSIFNKPNLTDLLKTDLVFIGLNEAVHDRKDGYKGSWMNFHSDDNKRQNDYKLRYALMDTPYWGSYITDLIKSHPDTISTNVIKGINKKQIKIEKHIEILKRELEILGEKPILVALGGDVYDVIKKHLANEYKIIKIYHYSYRMSKEKYREHLLETLERELRK